MKRIIIGLLIASFLLQISCSSITQIPYPIDESKSENEIGSLNYFGERLASTIHLTSSVEIEAYWLQMRNDKIYFLTEGLIDTTFISIDKVQNVKFYSRTMGCVKGMLPGLGITGLTILLVQIFVRDPGYIGYPILVGGSVLLVLGFIFGVNLLGNIEFNFVQSKSAKE